ncbi:DUF2690 domain-containing protein [Amycolatopsis magusensis]|uniref:DUF2690 domain-containing protein n=1 Tax=Amycolatopsis magusensis TaxID=882444 RepID=UPI003C2B1EE4
MRRRFALFTGAAAAALALGAAAPVSAQAVENSSGTKPASCFGDSCEGLDPITTACTSGAVTRASIVVRGTPGAKEFLVAARYSASCGTTWTTVTDINQPDCLYSVEAWHEGVNNATGAKTRTASVFSGDACSASTTTMSKAGKSTRACAYSTWESLTRCTAWI